MPIAVMRMLVDSASGVNQHAADQAYMAGLDQIPWPCRSRLQNGELIIERMVSESGRVQIPFPVEGRGEVMLSTGTLMQRDRPYRLEIELARGKLNQIRNQLADWQAVGLTVTPPVEAALQKALAQFSVAATRQEDPAQAALLARQTIQAAIEAGELLAEAYIEQSLAMRRQSGPLTTKVGVRLDRQPPQGAVAPLLSAFNAFNVPLLWRNVELSEGHFQWEPFDKLVNWCHEQGIFLSAGPLLRMDDRGMPGWLSIWEGDYEGLMSMASDYVAMVVQRYRGKIGLWNCAGRVNVGDVFGLQEEQKLQLAVRALEVTRSIDPNTPAVIRFDQPWGEYMRRAESDLSPLHFADALVRAGLQMGGLGLEINVGYHPGGTAARDRLDFSRMLDLWSCLGLPLHVTLTVPSSGEPDPKAQSPALPVAGNVPWTPEQQANWIKRYLPLMLAKVNVQSITWNQLSDADSHEFAHSGLFDVGGAAKPGFATLAAVRKKYGG